MFHTVQYLVALPGTRYQVPSKQTEGIANNRVDILKPGVNKNNYRYVRDPALSGAMTGMARIAEQNLASIEWSIALTSNLLLRGHSSLASHRPALEGQLQDIIRRWRGGAVADAFSAWHHHAMRIHHLYRKKCSDFVASLMHGRLSIALRIWQVHAVTAAVMLHQSAVADCFRARAALLHMVTACWRQSYLRAASILVLERHHAIVAVAAFRAWTLTAHNAHATAQRRLLSDACLRNRCIYAGWRAIWMEAARRSCHSQAVLAHSYRSSCQAMARALFMWRLVSESHARVIHLQQVLSLRIWLNKLAVGLANWRHVTLHTFRVSSVCSPASLSSMNAQRSALKFWATIAHEWCQHHVLIAQHHAVRRWTFTTRILLRLKVLKALGALHSLRHALHQWSHCIEAVAARSKATGRLQCLLKLHAWRRQAVRASLRQHAHRIASTAVQRSAALFRLHLAWRTVHQHAADMNITKLRARSVWCYQLRTVLARAHRGACLVEKYDAARAEYLMQADAFARARHMRQRAKVCSVWRLWATKRANLAEMGPLASRRRHLFVRGACQCFSPLNLPYAHLLS